MSDSLIISLAPWVVAIFGIIVAGALFLRGSLKNLKLEFLGNKVDLSPVSGEYEGTERREFPRLNYKRSQLNMIYLHLFSALHDGKTEYKNASWASQKDSVDDLEEDFFLLFESAGVSRRDADSAWQRLSTILKSAADNNHVRKYVIDGVVDSEYLDGKLDIFAKKYAMLSKWEGFSYPAFYSVEIGVRNIIESGLSKFGIIADENAKKFLELKKRLVGTIKDPKIRKFMEEVL